MTRDAADAIDAIREKITFWRAAHLISEVEEAFLLATLIDSADIRITGKRCARDAMGQLGQFSQNAHARIEQMNLQKIFG